MKKQFLLLILLIQLSFGKVIEITSEAQFQEVLNKKDTLLIFDLYADWCAPCKMLAPVLDELSNERKDALIYKINTEKLKGIAAQFGVRSIPHVTFIKNKQALNTINGVVPKIAYEQSIEILNGELKDTPDGTVFEGVRKIDLPKQDKVYNVHVYRGDKVEFTYPEKGQLLLPDLQQSGEHSKTGPTKIKFTAKKPGAYPVQISDHGLDKGKRVAWMIVMEYGAPDSKTTYKELTEDEFETGMKESGAFLLDVRTDGEYKESHIEGATLIPVQTLESRMNELSAHKNSPIYVYCRSGNRSTVASKMLLDKGFTKVYNLRNGIKGWTQNNKKTVQ